jgi:hypothetical protein
MSATKIGGVYAIYLIGTPFVYVGSSNSIELRWRDHARWVWPNEAKYVVVRDMPNSTRQQRQRTETALVRLLRRRGYWLLSKTVEEVASASGKLGGIVRANQPLVVRQEIARRAVQTKKARRV